MADKVVPGRRYGRWTVLEEAPSADSGARKWLCRCDCGTLRPVLDRSLRYGGSESCGCLRRERAEKAISMDLTGRIFGELTVLDRAPSSGKQGGILWRCRCSCGEEYRVLGTLLVNGRRTHCSGSSHPRKYARAEITGQRFALLTALYPSRERKDRRSVTWHCRCDCGNEIDVSYNNLVHGNMKSCGCRKKAHDLQLHQLQVHVDGTSVNMIRSRKIPTDNTTGCRGVSIVRGKYQAKIVFQKKAYYLGCFDTLEEAARVREEAEELLFGGASAFYDRWKARAQGDPQWAQENPIRITVTKDRLSGLQITFAPEEDRF